jgi:hypothetical protein
MEMQPVYRQCDRDRAAYLELISQELNLPIAMTSYGPTAREKDAYFFAVNAKDKATVQR